MVTDAQIQLGIWVVLAAFLPPLVYVIWIRNVERRNREPWGAIFRAFFFGAIVSVLIALLLEVLFDTNFNREYALNYNLQTFTIPKEIILAVIAAPVVEEFSKGWGVRRVRRHIDEIEDGIIYGAAVGLGFSATENLFYEIAALLEHDDYTFVAVAFMRSITSSFLHATASGILGYGMARRYLQGGIFLEILPYYALAVLLHATFNALATYINVGGFPIAGALFVILVSIFGIRWTVSRIRRLDQIGTPILYR